MLKTPTGCRPAQLLGPWAMEAQAYDQLYAQVELMLDSGRYEIVARESKEQAEANAASAPYVVDRGVAKFLVEGPMTRTPTSIQALTGGTATLPFQHAIRQASNDGFVNAIFIEGNSPGGTTEGLNDTAAEIARARAKKPVHFHVSGMGTSAMYRLGVEADVFTADAMSILGSVGTLTSMRDTSKLFEKAGITHHYVGSGDRKAVGWPGQPITPEQVAERKSLIDAINQSFLDAVSQRRPKITKENMTDVARAGLYDARRAVEMGLADAIATTDDAFDRFSQRIPFGQGRMLPTAG